MILLGKNVPEKKHLKKKGPFGGLRQVEERWISQRGALEEACGHWQRKRNRALKSERQGKTGIQKSERIGIPKKLDSFFGCTAPFTNLTLSGWFHWGFSPQRRLVKEEGFSGSMAVLRSPHKNGSESREIPWLRKASPAATAVAEAAPYMAVLCFLSPKSALTIVPCSL